VASGGKNETEFAPDQTLMIKGDVKNHWKSLHPEKPWR
jgi:hypothetical protein